MDAKTVVQLDSSTKKDTKAPRISVIIPLRTFTPLLSSTLTSLVPAALEGLLTEVIIVSADDSDQIVTFADAFGARLILSRPGRGLQLRKGAASARGDWLFFLHADSQPHSSWVHEVSRLFSVADAQQRAYYFRLHLDDEGFCPRLIEFGARLRNAALALPYGDQGLLIARALYEEVGGYPDWLLMEDVALVRRLGRRRLRGLKTHLNTSAERYQRHGYLKQSISNLRFLTLYLLGSSPSDLAARYESR